MTAPQEQTLSPSQIKTLQEQAWSATYAYTWAHSPFYQAHFRQAGLSPHACPSLDDLSAIPPIDKTVLSQNTAAFVCVPQRQVVDIVTTSGSTGQPLVWMLTEADLQRLALNECLSFQCAGFTADDTVLLAVTLDRAFIAGMAYFLGLRMLGCAVVRVGPATPVMHWEMLRRTGATAVVGVPSFLCLLADKAAEAKLDLPAFGVRPHAPVRGATNEESQPGAPRAADFQSAVSPTCSRPAPRRPPMSSGLQARDTADSKSALPFGVTKAVCIGEPVRHADFTLNRAGAAIAQRWGARVFSTYGVTELAASLCECAAGCGGHLHPELLFLEALDEAGQPVPDGQVGELTATTFGVEAMPLVRYRTGDFAALYRQPCACGRNTLRVGPIVGRKSHKLKIKGTTIFPATLQAVLEAAPGVSKYVVIARRAEPGSDLVEVRLACEGESATVLRALRERFQGEAKVTPQFTVASPAEIEALQMPEGARKRRFFVDLRE